MGQILPSTANTCFWPSHQMPVNDIATEIAEMPDGEFMKNCEEIKKMCKKPRIINGLYIVDKTPVAPTLDTVSAYQAGRNDMKLEIGEKVRKTIEIYHGSWMPGDCAAILLDIEGVK
ncbi:MAG: hypothetical protein KKC03_13915 [Bacteroidetes bacterium]|nr:hypothetical protein [Bacteroidota bacterium]